MTHLSKLDELHSKTQKELVQIINHGLDLGIHHARQALRSADAPVTAEEWCRRAKTSYLQVSRLIPLVVNIPADERGRLESQLEHLEGMLKSLSAIGSSPTPTEEEIASLARSLWEARGCPEGLPEHDWFLAERALKAGRSHAACL